MGIISRWKARRSAKKTPTPSPTPSTTYQGPIQPGTSATTFRSTGTSVPSSEVSSGGVSSHQGPIQPGTSEEIFRSTGTSVQDLITKPQVSSIAGQDLTPMQKFQASQSGGMGELQTIREDKTKQFFQDSNKTDLFKGKEIFITTGTGERTALKDYKPTIYKKTKGVGGGVQDVLVGGKQTIKIGDRSYVGDVYIEELGMTANEYKKEIQKRAVEQGIVKAGDQAKYTYHIKEDFGASQVPSDLNFLAPPEQDKGIYDIKVGGFIKPTYKLGAGGTGIITGLSLDEQTKITEAQKKGDIIDIRETFLEFPKHYLGGYLSESYTPEEYEKIGTFVDVINPIEQAKVFYTSQEYKKALPEFIKTNEKLEGLYNTFEKKWGGLITENQFTGNEEQYAKYSKDFSLLNAQYNYNQNTASYQKVLNEFQNRQTIGQKIANTGFSAKKRFLLNGLVGIAEFGAYTNPIYRVLAGTELGISGVETLSTAKKPKEIIKGGVELGIGALLLKSGVGGGVSILNKGGKSKGALSWLAKQEKKLGLKLLGEEGGIAQKTLLTLESKGGKVIKKLALPTYFSVESGIHTYKETEDLAGALGRGVGSFTALTLPMAFESIRGGTKLSEVESVKLKKSLKNLQNSKIIDATIIRKGKGKIKNSDKVEIKAIQESSGFKREIIIRGDLIKTNKGFTIFPEGKGTSKTIGQIRDIKNRLSKGYIDTQTFKIGQIGKGIPLGNIGEYQIGTSASISFYSPQLQTFKLFKISKGRFPVKQIREKKELLKDYLSKTEIQKGGTKIIEVESKGRTFSIERKEVKEKPFSKEIKKFEITDLSTELGKLSLKEPIDSVGTIFSKGRFGTFIKTISPKLKAHVIKKGKIKKTPFSKTFEYDMVSEKAKVKPSSTKKIKFETQQIQEKKKIPNIEKELTSKIIEITKKGLKQQTKKSIQRLKEVKLRTEIPLQAFSISAKSKERQKERQIAQQRASQLEKTKQKEAMAVSSIQIQKPSLKTLQKEALGIKQVLFEELKTEFLPTTLIKPRINVPFRPQRIPSLIIPFIPRKKKLVKQPIEKAPSYDVYIKPPKKKSYVKVTKSPVDLMSARDTRNFFIDSTTSRQGYLKPRQNKPSPLQYAIPRGYAKKTTKKFRDFKQVKGKRIKLKSERIIEKGKHLLDTKGERQQINIFKAMAQRERKKQKQIKKNLPIGLNFA